MIVDRGSSLRSSVVCLFSCWHQFSLQSCCTVALMELTLSSNFNGCGSALTVDSLAWCALAWLRFKRCNCLLRSCMRWYCRQLMLGELLTRDCLQSV